MKSQDIQTSAGAWRSPELPTYLFIYLIIGVLVDPKRSMLGDLDVCWLIRAGELIWQTGRIPETDIFSFTHYGQPWLLYQWGFEVFIGGLHMLAGLGGVVWGSGLLIASSYAIFFYFMLRLGIHRGHCIGLVALVMQINSFNWLSRPNTASIFFYIFLLLLLEGYRKSPSHRIWFLPLLFILWTNVHLGFTSGLMVVLLYGLWARFFPNGFREKEQYRDNRLLVVFILCLLATLINPYGPRLFTYLWELSRATTMNSSICELHSPDFHSPAHLTLILLFVLLFWFGGFRYPGRGVLFSLVSITLVMALFSARHIPYFSIPAIIHLSYIWVARKSQTSEVRVPRVDQTKGWGWGLAFAGVSLVAVVIIGNLRPEFYDFNEKWVPKGATDYLETVVGKPEPSRVFTSGGGTQWNDYLLYRLYPRIKVFIDTRFDMYGDAFFKNYLTLVNNLRCDLTSLDPWKIDFLILQKKEKKDNQKEDRSPLITPMGPPPALPPWKIVYEDEKTMVYRNLDNAPEN